MAPPRVAVIGAPRPVVGTVLAPGPYGASPTKAHLSAAGSRPGALAPTTG